MLNGPPPSASDPLDWLVSAVQRAQQTAQGVQQGLAPAIQAGSQIAPDQPLSPDYLVDIGLGPGTDFDISNNSTETVVVGNLSTASPPAVCGCMILWQVVRGTGATAYNGGGLNLVFANYYNGTGHGAWVIGMQSQGDASHQTGIVLTAAVVGDDLQLTFTADNSGADGKGRYWLKPFSTLQDTAP